MKKLILFFFVCVSLNINSLNAKSITSPIGEEVLGITIDQNATDIVLKNQQTGEVYLFSSAKEFNAQVISLNEGMYQLVYTVEGEIFKTRFKIK